MNKYIKTILLTVLLALCGVGAVAQTEREVRVNPNPTKETPTKEKTQEVKEDGISDSYVRSVVEEFSNREGRDSLTGQMAKYRTKMMVRTYGDSIVIRWLPLDAGVWMTTNNYGWNLYRSSSDPSDTVVSLDIHGDTIPYRLVNANGPIISMTLDEMMKNFDSTDVYAGAAAQALYGNMTYDINKQVPNDNLDMIGVVYKQYQEQTQRQFMAYLAAEVDPRVASALGMRFVDKNVRKGQYYEYMIQSLAPFDFLPIEPVSEMVLNQKFVRTQEEDVPEIQIDQVDIYKAVVHWAKNKLSGYYLERSEDNGKHWQVLTPKAPIWPMNPDSATYAVYGDTIAHWMEDEVVYIDSLDLTKTYIYRVQAFDAFGDKTDWRKSEKFKMTDFEPPFPPVLHSVTPINNEKCLIKWVKPVNEKDYLGCMVMFSRTNQGPWSAVTDQLSKTTFEYTDEHAQERGRGYYRIFAFDTAGNISYSVALLNFIEDVLPPSAPTGLNYVTDDSTGVVLLGWNPNNDQDLQAYKVYYANQRDHEFIERSKGYITDTFFLDTLDLTSLTLDVFYYVIAVDENNNYSYPSDTLRVVLPDFLPPTPPVLERTHQANDSVVITWIGSASTDVENYYIYRKFREAKNWECISVVPGDFPDKDNRIKLIDFPPASKHPYAYAIEAVDSSRNSSGKKGNAIIVVKESSIVTLDIRLKGSFDKKAGGVVLNWNYTYDSDKDYYGVVYRSVNGGVFEDVGTFRRGESSFVDYSAPADKDCSYYIQLQLGRGRCSSTSNKVSVKVK